MVHVIKHIGSSCLEGVFRLNCSRNVCIMYLGNAYVLGRMFRDGEMVRATFRVGGEAFVVRGWIQYKRYTGSQEYMVLHLPRQEWMRNKADYEVVVCREGG